MKRLSIAILSLLGMMVLSTANAAVVENVQDISRSSGNSVPYAYAYATAPQIGIGPHDTVALTSLGVHGRDFDLTSDGGIVVKKKGDYLIQFQVLASSQASLALYKNGRLINESAFSNIATTAPISGVMIINLSARDVITLRSIENYKTFNTIAPTTITTPTIPVSFVIQRVDDN